MSANVTFFEQILFFSSSIQDVYAIQQVLPIPLVEFVPHAPNNPNPIQKSSWAIITSSYYLPTQDQITSPMLHSESYLSSSSQSSLNN